VPTVQELILLAPPILLALTIHEVAHAWSADRLGDPTARMMGRLSLNPLRHLDPFGTILLFIAKFGWAKPVPVNPHNLRDPRRDLMWISLAGPASNVALAVAFGLVLRALGPGWLFGLVGGSLNQEAALGLMLYFGMIINVNLAVFNALPINPLDGGKILAGLLPASSAESLRTFERVAPYVLLAVVFVDIFTDAGIFAAVFLPLGRFASSVLAGYSLI
jgi:Zn-dependent protease